MNELFTTAVEGVNIIPTTLLGLVVLYWLFVTIGALDLSSLDIDIDVDADVDAISDPLHSIMIFFKIGRIPIGFVISVIILVFWVLSMAMHLLPFKTGGIVAGIFMLPSLIISALITKAILSPLEKAFRKGTKSEFEQEIVEGRRGILLCDMTFGRLGQVEIKRDGSPIIINVKTIKDEELQKGDEVLVLKKDEEKDFYLITKLEGVIDKWLT
ncbi:MAG: hypothetical protein A2Y23_00090 [Clostridiales bacterium GWB2_37_7]|nr:MAG: hypothetical protein A2Y23_00090 [Clostridiales bacterium GWB2_37_7]